MSIAHKTDIDRDPRVLERSQKDRYYRSTPNPDLPANGPAGNGLPSPLVDPMSPGNPTAVGELPSESPPESR
jgi:hypothetical protein